MNDMALTDRDMQIVKLAAREAAFAALIESDPALRMMVREEARPVALAEIARSNRITKLQIIIFALITSGIGGEASRLPDIMKAIATTTN